MVGEEKHLQQLSHYWTRHGGGHIHSTTALADGARALHVGVGCVLVPRQGVPLEFETSCGGAWSNWCAPNAAGDAAYQHVHQ